MFFKKSSADEIALSMENILVDGAINKQAELQNRIVKAADLLNAAAEILDETGMVVQAEFVTAILESLAGKKSKKNKAKKKPAKKMTSEKMVNNLKEKGWMFDESGTKDVNHAHDCAACGDVAYADDSDDELKKLMLDNFESEPSDLDFEDELDFSGFNDRLHDNFDLDEDSLDSDIVDDNSAFDW